MTAKKTFHFEKSLEQLHKIVDKIEQGNLPLEDALKNFEEGVTLIRQCQTALQAAEQKVSILTESNTNSQLKPFTDDE